MNNRIASPARALGLGFLLALAAWAGPTVAAGKVPATVRVVTWQGKVLYDKKLKTGSTTVKTSREADCLGGSPGNGRQNVPGPTALGILKQASQKAKQLRPLLLSDAFDFGLGLCGVGESVATGEQWWALKHNHASPTTGGEGTLLEKNDVVLWYLSESYNLETPDELYLEAPGKVKKNRTARVRVFAYDEAGRRRPVKGAKVKGADAAPTNGKGYARVTLKKKARLIARLPGMIPSNRVKVKVK